MRTCNQQNLSDPFSKPNKKKFQVLVWSTEISHVIFGFKWPHSLLSDEHDYWKTDDNFNIQNTAMVRINTDVMSILVSAVSGQRRRATR